MTTNRPKTPAPHRKRPNGDGTIFQRKDGRWEAAGYVLASDGTRKRIRVYGTTRRQAADKLIDALAANNHGLPAHPGDTTVGQYLKYWLNTVAVHRLRPTTWTRYDSTIRLYLLPGLGAKKLARLSTTDVRTWLDSQRTTCQCCARGLDAKRHPDPKHPTQKPRCCAIGQCCGKRLSPRTIQYIHAVLAAALQHAVREERITRNVARNVPAASGRHRRFVPFTAEEARAFLNAATGDPLHALWELTLRTGLRRGEALALTWNDLDPAARTLTIRRTLQYNPAGGLTLYPTKTQASERRIALPDVCLTLLQLHRKQQEQQHHDTEAKSTKADAWADSGLIFTRPDGSPLDPARVTKRFYALLATAGLRRIRFHDLRHSCASLLLDQGVDLVVIKELLGHAHISITAEIYAHVRLRLQHDAINRLSDALTNDDGPSEDDPSDTATDKPGDEDDPPLAAAPPR